MKRLLFCIFCLAMACSGPKTVEEKPVETARFLSIKMTPTETTVGDQTFALTSGDTLDRGPIEEAILAEGAEKDIKIQTDADVSFGLVAYIVDVATLASSYVDLTVGTRDPVKVMATPGDGFHDPYLIVTTKRDKPIAAQCPDPCDPGYVMVGHDANGMIGSVWSRGSTLTGSRYTWWLVANYGDMWKDQLKAQKETLTQCVHSAKADHGFGRVEVTVRFLIARTGQPEEIQFDHHDTKYQALYDCVTTAVRAIEMPRMAQTRVKYDYVFGGDPQPEE